MALGLARAGASVAVHGVEPTEVKAVAGEIAAIGGRGVALHADIAEPLACRDLVARATQALGPVDILVVNASFEERCDWRVVDHANIARHVAANFRATVDLLQATVPAMAERGWGRVVALGSIQEVKPNPALVVYAALKAAQSNMMVNLARQYAKSGVTLNVIAPGAIATERNRAVLADPQYRARVEAQIPSGRIGTPDDCVGACLLLCSDAGSYINGQTLFVDGGWHVS
jgi:NAD(P)-dependent dehydrogenase (short-subunit alcohol dehydrogenase family)